MTILTINRTKHKCGIGTMISNKEWRIKVFGTMDQSYYSYMHVSYIE